MSLRRIVFVPAAVAACAALAAAPASANHHRMRITEVFGGLAGRESAQFVELQMFTAGQNVVNGSSLAFLTPAGAAGGSFTFPVNVASGDDNDHVLAATNQAANFFGVTPDLTLTAPIDRAGGRVNFVARPTTAFGTIDAFSWGSFSGDATGSGTPFAQGTGGLPLGLSAVRDLSGGSVAGQLDAADDTGESADDFDAAPPTPTNNAGQTPSRATVVSRPGGGVIEVDAAEGVANLIDVDGDTTDGFSIVDTNAPVQLDPSATATCVRVNVVEAHCDAASPAAVTIEALDRNDRVRILGRIAATVFGGLGNDRLVGGNLRDTLHGDAGRDTITGGRAPDTVFAGADDDTVRVKGDDRSDDVDCGDGDDTIRFDAGLDVFPSTGPGACETAIP